MANVTNRAQAQYPAGPSTGAIIAAAVFWVVAIALVLATTVFDVPGWVWALRIITVLIGIGIAVGLILREKYLRDHGLPLDSDKTAFDLWTIAHTWAGVVMGTWAVPAILVVIFTIAWEFFEKYVPGFGDGEIFSNRVVDVLVAWVGWIALAAIIAAATQTSIPWGF
jgi:hypothetical protein